MSQVRQWWAFVTTNELGGGRHIGSLWQTLRFILLFWGAAETHGCMSPLGQIHREMKHIILLPGFVYSKSSHNGYATIL
jgi:hypothetical protein